MVNKRTESGETALLISVSREVLGCVQVLLDNGADPDITNKDRVTPLHKGSLRRNEHTAGSQSESRISNVKRAQLMYSRDE